MEKTEAKKTTKIIACNCKNDFQDERYGQGKRLHNACGKEHKDYKCTVCGSVKR